MKFDGRAFAREIEAELTNKVRNLAKRPRAVSFVVGEDPASLKYSELKKAAAERVGISFEVRKLKDVVELKRELGNLGEEVDGVMVQLPLPELLRGSTPKLLEAIPVGKDMDGLRWEESGVTPATVRAVLAILDKIALTTNYQLPTTNYVVVGARGTVGRPLVTKLKERGVEVVELDLGDDLGRVKEGEVVISCTGKSGIVTGNMVRDGIVAIDVGAPKGDMTSEVYEKASVYVPSPGGVGPVTIVSLLANLCDIMR